jgi:hypothetical protein
MQLLGKERRDLDSAAPGRVKGSPRHSRTLVAMLSTAVSP